MLLGKDSSRAIEHKAHNDHKAHKAHKDHKDHKDAHRNDSYICKIAAWHPESDCTRDRFTQGGHTG